jgi:hypothetical protein
MEGKIPEKGGEKYEARSNYPMLAAVLLLGGYQILLAKQPPGSCHQDPCGAANCSWTCYCEQLGMYTNCSFCVPCGP